MKATFYWAVPSVLIAVVAFSAWSRIKLPIEMSAKISSSQASEAGASLKDPFVKVDEKAKTALNDDAQGVQNLALEIFQSFGEVVIPSEFLSPLVNRVVMSEIKYRQGIRNEVTEQNLVKAHNELADKFQAPRYAKTSIPQVRMLRVELMRSPHYRTKNDVELWS